MDIDAYISQLATFPRPSSVADFTQLASWIEHNLPPTLPPAELRTLHDQLHARMSTQVEVVEDNQSKKKYVWHILLTNARLAPAVAASSWYMYAREIMGGKQLAVEELLVAASAYRWSNDTRGWLRVCNSLVNRLYRASRYPAAFRLGEDVLAQPESHAYPYELAALLINLAIAYTDTLSETTAAKATEYAYQALDYIERAHQQAEISLQREQAFKLEIFLLLGRVAQERSSNFQAAEQYYRQANDIISADPDTFGEQLFYVSLNQAILALRTKHYALATRRFDQLAQAWKAAKNTWATLDKLDLRDFYLYQLCQAVLLNDVPSARQHFAALEQLVPDQPALRAELQSARARLFVAMLSRADFSALTHASLSDLVQIADQFQHANQPLDAALTYLELARLAFADPEHSSAAPGYLQQAERLLAANVPQRLVDVELYTCLYDPSVAIKRIQALLAQLQADKDFVRVADLATVLGQRLLADHQAAAAQSRFVQAIDALEYARAYIRVSEHTLNFLAARRTPFEQVFVLTHQSDPLQALQVSDRLRSQVLVDELYYHDGFQSLLERNPQLSELHARRLAYDSTTLDSTLVSVARSSYQPSPANTDERKRLEQEYIQALNVAQASVDEVAWLQPPTLDVAQLQTMLGPSRAMVAFQVVQQPPAKPELWCIVVTDTQITPFLLVNSKDYSPFLRNWAKKSSLFSVQSPLASIDDVQAELADLFESLITPLLPHLPSSIQELVFLFDEQMPFLPLHAAFAPQRRYLCQDYAISYAPSAWAWLHCIKRERQRPLAAARVLAGWSPTLKHVPDELALLEKIWQTEAHLDSWSREQLLAALPTAGLAHLACHGRFDLERHPRFAALDWNKTPVDAHDFYSVQLQAALVTLNACDVGQYGKGMQGLASAALVSGASSVLASFWEVDDECAPEFMQHFYTALLEKGFSRAAALQAAQDAFIKATGRQPHPAIWAPFFLLGVTDPLPQ